jgi:Family of unknown function (DUF6011)
MTGGILKHSKALDFILGGKSFVTFLNTQTDNRFTFKVVKHKKEDIYFVNVLTSPDTYTFIGVVNSTGSFRHSRKSKITSEAQSVKVFSYVFSKLQTIVKPATQTEDAITALPQFIEVYHSGKCGRCGRKLTVPQSIETGFGPECFSFIADKQMIRDRKLTQILKGLE